MHWKYGLAVAAFLTAGPAYADIFPFTLSDGHGSGPFGSVTTTTNPNGSVNVSVNMTPNWLIENGGSSHNAFTFSTSLPGTITNLSAGFTALPYSPTAAYNNSPFQGFTDAINGTGCLPNGEGGCGSTLSFTIANFGSFIPATSSFNNQPVFAAVDICQKNLLPGACTFVVGLGNNPTPTPFLVPAPAIGAGLPGIVAALIGLWGLNKRRKNQLGI